MKLSTSYTLLPQVTSHFLLLLITLAHLHLCSCFPSIGHYCVADNVSSRSEITKNVDHVLSYLVSHVAINDNFVTTSYGHGTNAIHGLLQCRGDVNATICAECAKDAAAEAKSLCTNNSKAKLWFDYCYLRYDTDNFFGSLDTNQQVQYINPSSVENRPQVFQKKLAAMLSRVSSSAVKPGHRSIGTAESTYQSNVTLYALAQCTRDLASDLCSKCLATAIAEFPSCCVLREGAQISYGSCIVRYEIYEFFFPKGGKTISEAMEEGKVRRFYKSMN